jgi:hypothetical protein
MNDDPHQGLGTQRQFGDPRCSHCAEPTDPVGTLVIRFDGDRQRYQFCKTCEDILLAKLATLRWP